MRKDRKTVPLSRRTPRGCVDRDKRNKVDTMIENKEIGRVALRGYQTSNEAESKFEMVVGVNTEPQIVGGKLVEQVFAKDIVVSEEQNTDVRHDATKTTIATKVLSYEQTEKAVKAKKGTAPTGLASTSVPAAPNEGPKDKADYLKNMHDQLDNSVQKDRASQAATNNDLHGSDKKLFLFAGLALAASAIGIMIGIVALVKIL